MVTKEELEDRHITVANAADPWKRSENSERSIAKVEMFPAEVENMDCQESARPLKQEPSEPTSSCTSSSSKVGNKAKRLDTIVSNLFKMKNNGSAAVRIESTRTAKTASAEIGDIKHSIRESGSEDRDEGCDADMNDIWSSKQHHVKANPNDGKDDCDGGPLGCLDCTAVFETKAAFKLHIASHRGYRRHKCTVCEQRSTTKQNHMVHMRRHTGERPFKCDVCEKKFITNGALTVHKHIHTGDGPFKCLTCEKSFLFNGYLQRHNLIHTGERPFKCDVCEKFFIQSGQLTIHKRRIHTGERPFKCDICTKCFVRSDELQSHSRVHSGAKPYVCPTCGECFGQRHNLQRHKHRQHADPDADTQPDVSLLQNLPSSSLQADVSRETSLMEDSTITEKV